MPVLSPTRANITPESHAATELHPRPHARTDYPARVPGLSFAPAAAGLWRVSTADGALLGHIERRRVGDGDRYRARRLRPGHARPVELGEFWSPADAAEVFR